MPQDPLEGLPQARRARQIGTVTLQIHPGQHHVAMPRIDQRRDPLDHRAGRHRSAVAAAEGDRAEGAAMVAAPSARRSEEHTSELQSLMRISYAVFCLKKKICNIRYITTRKNKEYMRSARDRI